MDSSTINETISKLKKEAKKCESIEDLIELSYSFDFNGTKIEPIQIRDELEVFLKILEFLKPKIFLEIGTGQGGTLFLFTRILPSNAQIFSIDLPAEESFEGYAHWKEPFYHSFATNNQKIHTIRSDSHKQTTLQKLEELLQGKRLDLLYIDADHSHNGIKNDFEMYSKLVKEDGVVAFHDIIRGPGPGEVSLFWNDIKNKHEFIEINYSEPGQG